MGADSCGISLVALDLCCQVKRYSLTTAGVTTRVQDIGHIAGPVVPQVLLVRRCVSRVTQRCSVCIVENSQERSTRARARQIGAHAAQAFVAFIGTDAVGRRTGSTMPK